MEKDLKKLTRAIEWAACAVALVIIIATITLLT